MFAYGNLVMRDMPDRVTVLLKSGQAVPYDINNDFGLVITPGQELIRVQIVHRPQDAKKPNHEKPMRFLFIIPWEEIESLSLEYKNPPEIVMQQEETERELLREALAEDEEPEEEEGE